MKEDIKIPKVEGVSVAVVQELGEEDTIIYNVYLINQRPDKLEKVLVTSKGYATVKKTGEKVKTSTLRKSLGGVPPKSAQKIEPIMTDLFGLNNEYWVSFWIGTKMYDKSTFSFQKRLKKIILLIYLFSGKKVF